MNRSLRHLAVLMALVVLFAVAGPSAAQTVVVTPAPVVTYPAPVITYPAAPVVTYYRAPVVSYYAPAPVYPAPAATVTTYRYGLLPRNRVAVTTYGPAVVAPRPLLRYRPVYVYP